MAKMPTVQGMENAIDKVGREFIIHATFDPAHDGESFTVSAPDFTYSGTVPNELVADIIVPHMDTAYMVTVAGENVAVNVGHFFGFYPVSLGLPETDLHALTWAEINQIIADGNAEDYWNVGDEVDIQLDTNEVLTLQIYNFNHDDLADGSGKAGVTFGMKNLMGPPLRHMNATNTNATSFSGSEMYRWLTSTGEFASGGLWNSLPEELRAVIKPITKITSAGGAGGGTAPPSNTLLTETMSIFLFSQEEVNGGNTGIILGQGAPYPIYSDNASRIKEIAGAANWWWLRSPSMVNATNFRYVYIDGVGGGSTAISAGGVCFGFCV